MELCQLPDDGEPEPRTRAGLVGADAPLENRVPHRRIEPGPVVVHQDLDELIAVFSSA